VEAPLQAFFPQLSTNMAHSAPLKQATNIYSKLQFNLY